MSVWQKSIYYSQSPTNFIKSNLPCTCPSAQNDVRASYNIHYDVETSLKNFHCPNIFVRCVTVLSGNGCPYICSNSIGKSRSTAER